jgi:hypothetical protein
MGSFLRAQALFFRSSIIIGGDQFFSPFPIDDEEEEDDFRRRK